MVFMMCFLMGGLKMSKELKHLLMVLLSLEFMMLMLFALSVVVSVQFMGVYLFIILLIFGVCEGALGLTLLVVLVRKIGGDYLNIFGLLM
uniref:NADH-ubiquinone oxidoreductase chain 4L n=1 Tax=Bilobella aurantiaca TaxID=106915 RepID=B5KMC9_BILAU|nr:NADH dehydrogenase subunit 4L [Bilobella aurantiaca]ABS88972.1 NADH dehydrogenase subunit 4L [Bilobella aurantiaca]